LSNWDAVLFDLDDTLYLERDYVASGLRAVSAWASGCLGVSEEEACRELSKLYWGDCHSRTFDCWLARRGIEPGWAGPMVEVYREHTPQIHPLPGVRELLARLEQRCPLGLVSDGWAAVQRRKLAALRLGYHFRAVVFSDELGHDRWKPSTAPFEAALARLRVDARRTVYIGDNPAKDFRGARQCGILSVRIRHPGGVHRTAEPATAEDAPDREIAALEELERWQG
jgi:putative hydrolase of the HAD superfamily